MSEQETGISIQAQAASQAWIRIERARHPQRPYPMDFIEKIFTDFSEIHGDRAYGDDEAEAIARNLLEMSRLRVPTISIISGEGGSGGALALAVSDRVLILENALYFVIT